MGIKHFFSTQPESIELVYGDKQDSSFEETERGLVPQHVPAQYDIQG